MVVVVVWWWWVLCEGTKRPSMDSCRNGVPYHIPLTFFHLLCVPHSLGGTVPHPLSICCPLDSYFTPSTIIVRFLFCFVFVIRLFKQIFTINWRYNQLLMISYLVCIALYYVIHPLSYNLQAGNIILLFRQHKVSVEG